MSEFGVGPEDWIEFDLDELNRDRRSRVLELVEENRDDVEDIVGGEFETVVRSDGSIGIVVHGDDVATAERSVDGRLQITVTAPSGDYL